VGLLPVSLYLRPLLESAETVPRWDAEHALARSAAARTEAAQAFLRYAKRWWGEFKSVHPSFKARGVKIFGENERGEFLPVCSYVAPLAAGRLLETPSRAARFVSLIPFRRDESLAGSSGGGSGARRELWLAPHLTLALRQGDVEAHAALLCSLLLGFGLEAYVALGSRLDGEGREGEYAWVVTRYAEASTPSSASSSATPTSYPAGQRRTETGPDAAETRATGGAAATPGYGPHATAAASADASAAPRARAVFWDPLTGQRSDPAAGPSAAGFSYYRLAAVFNHLSFHANQALHDGAAAVRWGDWADVTQWKTVGCACMIHSSSSSSSVTCVRPSQSRACILSLHRLGWLCCGASVFFLSSPTLFSTFTSLHVRPSTRSLLADGPRDAARAAALPRRSSVAALARSSRSV
jgi:hypothetical protein